MISIRIKLTFFMCLLVIIIDTLSCLFLLRHMKHVQMDVFKKLGMSFITLLTDDSDVKLALTYGQPAFLDAPVKRMRIFDRDEDIVYWRISDVKTVVNEGESGASSVKITENPVINNLESPAPLFNSVIASSGEVIYDFSAPVFEKEIFSEEEFATQVLNEDKITTAAKKHVVGYVQIGLSTRKLNKKIHNFVWNSVLPMGAIIILTGMGITFFFTRRIAFPLQRMAGITLKIAGGELTHTVDVRSNDEIGLLSTNFNRMTNALQKSHTDLKREIVEHEHTVELLRYRVKMEEIIANVSTSFINLAPSEVDAGINRALKAIGEFAGIDRSYVFLYSGGDREKMDNTHEWCAEGIEPQIANLKAVPVAHFPWGMEKLKRFETIHVPRVADLPDSAGAEKELQQSQSVQSFVVVPMIYGGSLIGFLGFDSVRAEKTWTDEDISLLKMVGEIFVNALERRRTAEMLQKAYEGLEERVKERTIELLRANRLLYEEVTGHKKAREALKKYEILISEIHDLPYIVDTKGNILFVNHIFEKLTGHKREEFMGKPFAPLFDEENLKKAMDVFTRTLNGECPQYELYFKDTAILCEYKNLPLKDEMGNIVGVIGIARDITERQKMLDALRQAKEYAENLIETANVMVVGMDVDGNIHIFNKAAEEITGYSKEEIIGKNCFDTYVPKDRYPEVLEEFIQGKVAGQYPRTYENQIITKQEKIRYMSWQISELREHGRLIGSISFGNDITEQKRMEALVERMRLTSFVRDVGVALTQDKSLPEILSQCAGSIVHNLDAALARIWIFNEQENVLDLQASAGMYTHTNGAHSRIPIGKLKIGRIARERQPYLTDSLGDDPYISDRDWVMREGLVAFAGYPLVVENRLVGVMAMFSRKPLSRFVLNAIGSSSDIIAMGINRKQTEQIQLANLRYFKSMNIISTATRHTLEIHIMLQNTVDALLSIFNCDRAWISYPCDPQTSAITVRYEANNPLYSDTARNFIPSLLTDESIQAALNSRDPLVLDITSPEMKPKTRSLLEQGSVQSLMAIPVHTRHGSPWIMGIQQCSTARKWAMDDQALFKDISNKIADVLTNVLLYRDLQLSEDKYRTLLENLPQRIFHKDKNLIYVSCNKNYADDLKIKPEEIAGKTDYDFYPTALAEKYRTDDKRIIISGKTEDMEEKYIRDGKELIIHTIKTPIRDENGNITGILGVFWDVTEKVALQMEAVRSRHLASVGELAAGVAHEINNPITGVINCAQILSDKSAEGSKEKDIAERIVKEGRRIANIVKELLFFARPGDIKEKKTAVTIHEILSNTLVLSESQLQKELITVRSDIPRGLPEIIVHPQRIQQVFLNIISNARYALNQKYPGRHDDKILEICGEEVTIDNRRYVKITFCDHGTGIPADIIDKVMDPFFSIKPRGKGTGLGLSISHGIVREHGGKLTIESVEGEFTKVAVVLPCVAI